MTMASFLASASAMSMRSPGGSPCHSLVSSMNMMGGFREVGLGVATISGAASRIYIRGKDNLYCIGAK